MAEFDDQEHLLASVQEFQRSRAATSILQYFDDLELLSGKNMGKTAATMPSALRYARQQQKNRQKKKKMTLSTPGSQAKDNHDDILTGVAPLWLYINMDERQERAQAIEHDLIRLGVEPTHVQRVPAVTPKSFSFSRPKEDKPVHMGGVAASHKAVPGARVTVIPGEGEAWPFWASEIESAVVISHLRSRSRQHTEQGCHLLLCSRMTYPLSGFPFGGAVTDRF